MEWVIIIAIIIGWHVLKSHFASNSEPEMSRELLVRLYDTRMGDDDTGPVIKEIQCKGVVPIRTGTNIGFITSVFDETSGNLEPMTSILDDFQEQGSIVYQHRTDVGYMGVDYGWNKWVKLGVVIPDIIQPPYGGDRNLLVIIRLVDLDNPPSLVHGFHNENETGIIWQKSLKFTHYFSEKGYLEAVEHRDEAISISLKIGVAVSMADGSLDDSEGNVLKNWIIKSTTPYSEARQAVLKETYNNAMKEAFDAASNGELVLSSLTERLNEIGEKAVKYETIDLCYEVMAADGVADTEEINIIRKIAESLDLNMDEVDRLRDQKIIKLDTETQDHTSIENILGINKDWSDQEIKKHLRIEFQKWNNRLNTLSEGEERKNAQAMLDKIAEARKTYG